MEDEKVTINRNAKKWIVGIAEVLLILLSGFLPSLFFNNSYVAIIATLALIITLIGVFQYLKNTKFAELYVCEDGTKPPKAQRKVVLTMLHGAVGFTIAYGLFGIVYSLIIGYEGSYGFYIGSIILGAMLIIVAGSRDREFKEEINVVKKEMHLYEKDERIMGNYYKASGQTLWVTLAVLLVFGAVVVIMPITDINIIAFAILGICALGFLLYTVLFNIYEGDKEPCEKSDKRRLFESGAKFILSLVPVILLLFRWILYGLSGVGITFFFVFIIVSIVILIDVVMRVRWMKRI